MEENSVPEAIDLPAAEGCGNELTRPSSDSPSSVTVDNSKDFVRRKTNEKPCTAWTNEKHNSYIASLEASFVKQLHHSLGLASRHSKQNTCEPSPSRQLPVNAGYSSDQFTGLQDGFWQNMKFEGNQPLPYSTAGSPIVQESPRICHFRCSAKHSTIRTANLRECSTFCSEEKLSREKRIFSHRLSISGRQCQDAVGNIAGAEVSDQNFVDEDREEMPSSLSSAKRSKMAAADASTNDQMVPCLNLFTAGISTASNNS